MKYLFLLVLIALWPCSLLAQNSGMLTGKVDDGEQPLPYTTVQLEGSEIATLTDESGLFVMENVPAGSLTLMVRQVGFQPVTYRVHLDQDERKNVKISLREDLLNLNEVVVSGTRYELSRKESPVVVNILSPRMLNATQSMALSEGLHYQPGVRVENNCQNCGFTQVRLNGLEGAYSQILVNSRPVFSALNQVYGLEQLPTNIVERVEVVRSGGSALYGSNAIAGTINIITRDPVENTWEVGTNTALMGGSSLDHTLNFNTSLVSDDLSSGATFYGMFRDRQAYDANQDGFTEITQLDNTTFGTKVFFKPNDRSKITADFNTLQEYRRGGDRLELAPHFTDIAEELEHNTLFSGLTYDLFSKGGLSKFTAYVSGQRSERDSYYGGLGGERSPEDSLLAINAYGQTHDLSWVGGLQYTQTFMTDHTLTMGVESQYNDVLDQIPGYEKRVDQRITSTGLYGQFEWQISENLKSLIGARYDITQVDGLYEIQEIKRESDADLGVLSPRLTLMYNFDESLQLRAGYARGFRAPQAFNEDLHISSVGGEPQFVILSDQLDVEFSDALTTSLNYSRSFGDVQANFLIEGFYTDLQNPFTLVSTGASLANGSIIEEVRNGEGAVVSGVNFELSAAPSAKLNFQMGGTAQSARYKSPQVLFEPVMPSEDEPIILVDEFVRNPNVYGYFASEWLPSEKLELNLTGTYTGPMTVPRVVSESGYLSLERSPAFLDMNVKLSYHFEIRERLHLTLNGGVQNLLDSFQDDFDRGPTRDSDYVYGPLRPRTYFFGINIGNFH